MIMMILYLNKSPYDNGKLSGEYFKDNVKIDIDNAKKYYQIITLKIKLLCSSIL